MVFRSSAQSFRKLALVNIIFLYCLPEMRKEQINIPFKESATLALWKVDAKTSVDGKHVFLTHGTFSNRKVCLGICEFLVKHGFTCWILEWRNHGESARLNQLYNFERIGKEDIKAAFDYLFEHEKLKEIDCVTHSGGAISLTINLIEYPKYISKIKKMVFFAGQSSGAAYNFRNRLKIQIGKYLTKAIGQIPAKRLGRPHNESYFFMKQWFDWNLTNTFTSDNGKDYRLEMPKIEIPILAIGGSGDNFIAPVIGCKAFLDGFKNPQNKFLTCGTATGYSENYNHSRIIYSRNAAREIYPAVLEWLE